MLGDSISTLDGYSEPDGASFYVGDTKFKAEVFQPEDTWWGMLIDALGGELLVNNSISGSTVCNRPGYSYPSYGCSDERTSALDRKGIAPDVIIVAMGMNDWGRGVRLHPEGGEEDGDFFFSFAYRSMLKKLHTNYPAAEIRCLTFPVSRFSKVPDFVFPYRYGGRHMREYCDEIRRLAKEEDCLLWDLNAIPVPYDTIDGFHPNLSGMHTLAENLLRLVENF